jgi:hypothetical protein
MRAFLEENYVVRAYPEVETRSVPGHPEQIQIATPWIELEVQCDEPHAELDWIEFINFPVINILARDCDIGMVAAIPDDRRLSTEEILALSKVGSLHDTLTVFTLLRLNRLRAASQSQALNSYFDGLNYHKKEDFIRALQQAHYVTSHCLMAVTPALTAFPEAHDLIDSFLKEEDGHDRLMERALAALGAQVNRALVSSETREVIALLETAARTNPTGFAVLVSAFEGNPYADEDPLARAMKDAGFHKASTPVSMHHRINRDHGHPLVGLWFLTRRSRAGEDEVREACMMLERFITLSETGN